MEVIGNIGIISYLIKHQSFRKRADLMPTEIPTPKRLDRIESLGSRWLSMLQHFDVPMADLGDRVGVFLDNRLSSTTRAISAEFGIEISSILSLPNYKMTPYDWKCPVCGRDKIALFRDAGGSVSRTNFLHRHHDHIEDSFGIFRFRKTILCAECNHFDGRLKLALEESGLLPLRDWSKTTACSATNRFDPISAVPRFFSFSPSELALISSSNRAPLIGLKETEVARTIFEGLSAGGSDSILGAARDYSSAIGTGSSVRDEDGLTLHRELGVGFDELRFFVEDLLSGSDGKELNPGCKAYYPKLLGRRVNTRPTAKASIEEIYHTDSYSFSMRPFSVWNRGFEKPGFADFYLTGAIGSISDFNPFGDEVTYGYPAFRDWIKCCETLDKCDDDLSFLFNGEVDGPWSVSTQRIMLEYPNADIKFNEAYIYSGETWRCSCCSRSKLESVSVSKKTRTHLTCYTYGDVPFEAMLHFPASVICHDCRTISDKANKIARMLFADLPRPVFDFLQRNYPDPEEAQNHFISHFRFSPDVLKHLRKCLIGKTLPTERVLSGLIWWMGDHGFEDFVGIADQDFSFNTLCKRLDIAPFSAAKVMQAMCRSPAKESMVLPGQHYMIPAFTSRDRSRPEFDPHLHIQMIQQWMTSKIDESLTEGDSIFDFATSLANRGITLKIGNRQRLFLVYQCCFVRANGGDLSRTLENMKSRGLHLPSDLAKRISAQADAQGGIIAVADITLEPVREP